MKRLSAFLVSALLAFSAAVRAGSVEPDRTLFGLTFGEDRAEKALEIFGGCAEHTVNGSLHEIIIRKGAAGACRLFPNADATVAFFFRPEDRTLHQINVVLEQKSDLPVILARADLGSIVSNVQTRYFPFRNKDVDAHGDLIVKLSHDGLRLMILDARKEYADLDAYRSIPGAQVPLGSVLRIGKSTREGLKIVFNAFDCSTQESAGVWAEYRCERPLVDTKATSSRLTFVNNVLVSVREEYPADQWESVKQSFSDAGWIWRFRKSKYDTFVHPRYIGNKFSRDGLVVRVYGGEKLPYVSAEYVVSLASASSFLDAKLQDKH